MGSLVRIMNISIIVVFLAMLIIPFLFVDLGTSRVSIKENRMLAERPRIADIKNNPETFIREFDVWFKDSTGFRENLITIHGLIDKNSWINGVRYEIGQFVYLVGKEGHHYCADINGSLIPKFQGKKIFSGDQLSSMSNKIEEVKTYLEARNIPLIIMFCTDKESVYPEFYPRSITRGPEPIQLDLITTYLKENTGVDVFNIRKALLAQKNNFLTYPLVDNPLFYSGYLHYNEIGAFFAYRELMRHINAYFPDIKPYEIDDVDITYDEKENPIVSLRKATYKKLDSSFFDDVDYNIQFSWGNEAYENLGQDAPAILFFRDSYALENYLGKYFSQHFKKTIFIHFFNFKNIYDYVEKYNPDIVVFECAERGIEQFYNFIQVIPELSIN